jgi:hypothetical protein
MSRRHLIGLLVAAVLMGSSESPMRASGSSAEVVIAWNQVLQDTIPGSLGPTAPRYFAMLHVAMFDAIAAIEREFQPFRTVVRHRPGGSPEAAAAQAARDGLAGLFPASPATYDAALAQRLGPHPSGYVRRGAAVGAFVAKATLEWRQNDGWLSAPLTYVPPPFPGLWQPTPPGFAAAGLTQAPAAAPFGILTPTQFLPPPHPSLTSTRYAADFNETKLLGRFDSTARTPDQTAIARLWAGIGANGIGTATNLFSIWNNIVRDLVRDRGLSLVEAARLFALVNVSIHDSLQSSATSKFVYGLWRPVTAIRRADEDLNDATEPDVAWLSLLATPPYPSYAGNMASVGAGAARSLELALGTSEIQVSARWRQSNGEPDVVHTKPDMWELAEEQALSRVYGGIHYQFDSDAGKSIGTRVGDFVFAHYMRPRRDQ